MTSVNDISYPIYSIPPMGLNPGPTFTLPPARPYMPPPQVPVTRPLQSRFYINTTEPNPFSIKPIDTEWKTNELLMADPQLRVAARVSMEDIGLKQSSNYVSPMHIYPGWKWCGGYNGCEYSSGPDPRPNASEIYYPTSAYARTSVPHGYMPTCQSKN
jgi:hypothetical protein